MKKTLTLLLLLAGLGTHAQTPQKIADRGTGCGSDPNRAVAFKGKLYFLATDSDHGRELWMYDGVNKPGLVYDLNPGQGWGTITGTNESMVVFNNKLYFPGNNGKTGVELYSYDGTNPPALAAEIMPGAAGCGIMHSFLSFGSKMYFSATSPNNGQELFAFDGVRAKLIDVYPGVNGSEPKELTAYGGKIYFPGEWENAGSELICYDTLTQKASLVQDIKGGIFTCTNAPMGSAVHSLQVVNNKLYFSAFVAEGSELHEFDGTYVTRLTDLAPGSLSAICPLGHGQLRVLGNLRGDIVLSAAPDERNYQLWKYSPSTQKTTLIFNITTGRTASPHSFTEYNGKLYFAAMDNSGKEQLWSTDGTITRQVAVINPVNSSSPCNFSVWSGNLYFSANGQTDGMGLYRLSTPASVAHLNMPGATRIYPNPARDAAKLEIAADREIVLGIQLRDITGRLVWTRPVSTFPAATSVVDIPLTALSSGVYWYQLSDAQGQPVSAGSVVKE